MSLIGVRIFGFSVLFRARVNRMILSELNQFMVEDEESEDDFFFLVSVDSRSMRSQLLSVFERCRLADEAVTSQVGSLVLASMDMDAEKGGLLRVDLPRTFSALKARDNELAFWLMVRERFMYGLALDVRAELNVPVLVLAIDDNE